MKTKHNSNFPDSNCEIQGCKEVASKIIRTKLVCGKCYRIILRDNIRKFTKGEDITQDLTVYKGCYRYRCTNRLPAILKYDENGEFHPKYCSEKCELKDKQVDDRYKILNEMAKERGKEIKTLKNMF